MCNGYSDGINMVNYGIIGCGMMGHEHLKNIKLLDGTNISAIFEPNSGMAQSALQLAPEAALVDNLKKLLEFPDLDCLVIASPNHCHLNQLFKISEIQKLPILVEKPLFTAVEDKELILKFIRDYQAPVWVAMEYRYMPPISSFINNVETVTGGINMLTIREHRFPFLRKVGDWNRFNINSGGTFVEKCCHFFDLMRLITKSEPKRIMASAGQNVNHIDEVYNGKKSDILDNGYVIVDFENGVRAMLELCMFAEGSKYQEEIIALGHKGKLETKIPGPVRFWPQKLGDPPVPLIIKSPRHPMGPQVTEVKVDPVLLEAGDHHGSTYYQHRRFLELVRGKIHKPDVTLEDGYKSVIMGMAAQESAKEGRAVEFD